MSSPNPYEPSPIPEEEPLSKKPAATGDEYEVPPFRSPQWLGLVGIFLLGVVILFTAAEGYSTIHLYRLQHESMPDGQLDTKAISVWGSLWNILNVTIWPMSIIAHLWMIAWVYRCHRNLESLGHGALDSKHIWAVICWFVPVLNLFCPFQVVREIWWRSHPLATNSPDSAPASHLVFWWWLLKVAAAVTAYMSRWFSSYETGPQYYTWLRTFLLSCACDVLSAMLAMLIIYRISQWQLARYRRLQESSAVT
jgi:hypothetical protein